MRQLEPAARDFIGFMAIVGYEHKNPVGGTPHSYRGVKQSLCPGPALSAEFTNLRLVRSWAAMYFVEVKVCSIRIFDTASAMSEGSLPVVESSVGSFQPPSYLRTQYFTEFSVQAFCPQFATSFAWISLYPCPFRR
jgi:hypothetical protein